eukprot:GHVL01041573.1.p1 GENE.GHVL01041573.1~~GHVL01041573.1.p1  ORF type:complete len:302 (-),score=39.14 GHVL01041573.1:398-1303(-)
MTKISQECQTVISAREYLSPQVLASQPRDEWPEWFDKPHTITILAAALGFVWLMSEWQGDNLTTRQNAIIGVTAASVVFLVFSILQLPDGILIRPHPVVWRLVKGFSVMYLIVLVFLLYQNLDDVRKALGNIDPSIGRPLTERNYAGDCRLFTSNDPRGPMANIQDRIDIFVLAHYFGWLVKALVIRDVVLLSSLSILFELSEVAFEHLLPNFHECWWDHLLLDIFGCNFLGILTGLWLCNVFRVKNYYWNVNSNEKRRKSFKSETVLERFGLDIDGHIFLLICAHTLFLFSLVLWLTKST